MQAWLYHAEEGDYEAAWRVLVDDNPLPAVHGRVCYHPCETACNRGQLDQAVSIHAVERFLGDEALRQGWAVAPGAGTGKKVLVVGAGPSGLSAAYHLRRLETGEAPRLGRRVVVYGGGDTALDAARTAKRPGAEETLIVYRRTRAQMPAQAGEVE